MPAALVQRRLVVTLVLFGGAAPVPPPTQRAAPLRKSDLVRLLVGAPLAPDELAARIRQQCVSFTPTKKDRADLVALGADSSVLREIDDCTRRAARAHPAAARPGPRPITPPAAQASVPPSTPPPASRALSPSLGPAPLLSSVRTGFVLGVGQHAVAGARAPVPLLFEVRDTVGLPVPGQEVAFTVTNGRLDAPRAITDSGGRLNVGVTLGPKAGPVDVTATVGPIARHALLYADAGPATELLLHCGPLDIERGLSLAPSTPVTLGVTARDALGNPTAMTGLEAASGDAAVLRVMTVGVDGPAGRVRVTPGDGGSTTLVVAASGARADLRVLVSPTRPADATPCP
ncbi:MAG TPA: Ig-like domain-containing protein [Gemmatimonadales bacterium]|nr:Ig-like domain-containing protein [Gemmatimonadales bacterium]